MPQEKSAQKKEIHDLIHQAERLRLQRRYDEALEIFKDAIERSEANGLDCTWALAHKGETHFALAQIKDKDSVITEATKEYNKALYNFNKALGMSDSNNNTSANPTIILPDQDYDYSWALVHRAEVLRTMANRMSTSEQDGASYFNEAIKWFKAVAAIPDENKESGYAWALAHYGAALVNRRGGAADYREAVKAFDQALYHTNQEYPWCLAYRALAEFLLDEKTAFYDLVAATIMDNQILEELFLPAGEFRLDSHDQMIKAPGTRYVRALWLYLHALKETPRDKRQHAKVLYQEAVLLHCVYLREQQLHNFFEKTPVKHLNLQIPNIDKNSLLIDILRRVMPEDTQQAWTSLTDEVTRNQNNLLKAIQKARQALEKLAEELVGSDNTLTIDIPYMKGGLFALEQQKNDAFTCLQEAVNEATALGRDEKNRLKKWLLADVAWYDLQIDPDHKKEFQKIIEEL